MKITIKIDKPESCSKCPFCHSTSMIDYCWLDKPEMKFNRYVDGQLPEWCPLNKSKED